MWMPISPFPLISALDPWVYVAKDGFYFNHMTFAIPFLILTGQ